MSAFRKADRDDLRKLFQPSRIVLAVVEDAFHGRFNVLPLCFHTWCSYDPLLYAVAVDKANYSSKLFSEATEFVLSVPGERMLEAVVYSGTHSGREHDKVRECGIEWSDSRKVNPPGVSSSLANIEMQAVAKYPTGDHLLVVGEVLAIWIAEKLVERPLLAVGPSSVGYEVLARQGTHTIGVPLLR